MLFDFHKKNKLDDKKKIDPSSSSVLLSKVFPSSDAKREFHSRNIFDIINYSIPETRNSFEPKKHLLSALPSIWMEVIFFDSSFFPQWNETRDGFCFLLKWALLRSSDILFLLLESYWGTKKGKSPVQSRVTSFCILFLHGTTLKATAATHRFVQDIGFCPPSISGFGSWYSSSGTLLRMHEIDIYVHNKDRVARRSCCHLC